MSSDWNVDDAVNEVMARIDDGSALPFLGVHQDLMLKSAYHGCFENAKAASVDWEIARGRVLPLAYMVGAVATMLTAADQAAKKTLSKPERVLPEHAWQAAYLISKVCNYTGSIDGVMCDHKKFLNGAGTPKENDEIASCLREIFRILKV